MTTDPSATPTMFSTILRVALLGATGLLILLFVIIVPLSIPGFRMTAVRSVLAVAGAAPPHDSYGHTNILLLGTGDKNHDGADLTDTMIIASVDPSTGSVVMLSVPRDLYLTGSTNLPDGRINMLYVSFKGRERATHPHITDDEASHLALQDTADAVSTLFGVSIQGVIKVDFTAFTNAVDALGGVDVVAQKPITDYTYPIREGATALFHLDAGPQHLDGETALKFARSRHGSTDFDRSQRQRHLLDAMSAKLSSMNRLQQFNFVSAFWQSVLSHAQTSFSTQQILGLAQIATALSTKNIISEGINFNAGGDVQNASAGGFLYSPDPALYQGADVLIPTVLPTDPTGWLQIRTYVSFLLNHRDLFISDLPMTVSNVSANSLSAYRLQNELRRYGFDVETVKSQPGIKKKVTLAESFLTFTQGSDRHVAGFLGNLLHMQVSQAAPDAGATGSLIRIVLGKDYKFVPFQVLGTGANIGR